MYNREGEQMEKEEYKKISEVIYIIDRSRSMYGKEEEITESFNRWLAQQKQMKKEALVTLALCNEECELLYCRMPLKYVKPLVPLLTIQKATVPIWTVQKKFWICCQSSCRKRRNPGRMSVCT